MESLLLLSISIGFGNAEAKPSCGLLRIPPGKGSEACKGVDQGVLENARKRGIAGVASLRDCARGM